MLDDCKGGKIGKGGKRRGEKDWKMGRKGREEGGEIGKGMERGEERR